MADHQIPETPEQVTDDWLTRALRESGAVEQASVTGHRSELVKMQGAAAVVTRIELDYDTADSGAPTSLIAKFASPHAPMRELVHGFGLYLREIEFYRNFGTDPGIPTPRCFHAEIDSASGVFALLLEDLSESRGGDGALPSVEDAEMAVRHLAPFHAKWWNHERLRDLDFLRFPGSPAHEAFMAMARGTLAGALEATKERFGSEFPVSLAAVVERLLANWEALTESRKEAHDNATLVHGDYHPQQLFFPSERGGRFAAIDWQTVNAGNGGDDLARIIAMGLSVEQREAADGHLIELYHSLLIESGVTGYDIGQCREGFRRGLLTSVIVNVIAGASIDPALIAEYEALRGVSVTEGLFFSLAAAVEAHDALGAVPT